MTHHFRTITAVIQVDDASDLRYPGFAMETARKALEAGGFTVVRCRNEHNDTGDLPPTTRGGEGGSYAQPAA